MRTNYVLIDYENVQLGSLPDLSAEHFKLLVFVGASQSKIPLAFASGMQRLGENAKYVQIAGNGPNAVDFHIAFYIGRISTQDAQGYFHVISRDTGFDPLITHLRVHGISVLRSARVDEIPLLKAAQATTVDERSDVVLSNLTSRGDSKPATLKTLSSTVAALFQKKLTEEEILLVIEHLQRKGVLHMGEHQRVTYSLPSGGSPAVGT